MNNEKGYVRAFDVRTGKRFGFSIRFRFSASSARHWEQESWANTGNAGVWGQMSVDEQSASYLPVELPTATIMAAIAPAPACLARALSRGSDDGQRKWHYQLVHHGHLDMDIPDAPILADINVNGRAIKAVASRRNRAGSMSSTA